MTTPATKAATVTLTFTREQVSDLLGALNSASIARRQQAKRTRKDAERARACEIIARDYDHLFCTVVRARQEADAAVQADAQFQADVDANYSTTVWTP
jgi:hypothetical protein